MKIRNGFVSNSSSSSFMLYKKDKELSCEDRVNKTTAVMEQYCAPYDEEDRERYRSSAQKIAESGRYMVAKKRIEWGGEKAIDEIVPIILETLGIDKDEITYEWGE